MPTIETIIILGMAYLGLIAALVLPRYLLRRIRGNRK